MLTLRDVHAADLRLRIWCLRCARGVEREKFAPLDIDLVTARARYRCTVCRQKDMVLLLPASWPPMEEMSWERIVWAAFHNSRSAAKREKDMAEARRWARRFYARPRDP